MGEFAWKGAPRPIRVSNYPADGSPAWWIGEHEDRIVLTVCAIDLGFDAPAPGYVFIKDYGHTHEGLADALAAQGIAELATRIQINPYGSKIAIMRSLGNEATEGNERKNHEE